MKTTTSTSKGPLQETLNNIECKKTQRINKLKPNKKMKKQYKLLLLFFILTNLFKSYSQDYDVNLSPEGKLEIIYDNQGNQFKLEE